MIYFQIIFSRENHFFDMNSLLFFEGVSVGRKASYMMLSGLLRLVGGLLFSSFKESRWAGKHHVPCHDAFRSTATCKDQGVFMLFFSLLSRSLGGSESIMSCMMLSDLPRLVGVFYTLLLRSLGGPESIIHHDAFWSTLLRLVRSLHTLYLRSFGGPESIIVLEVSVSSFKISSSSSKFEVSFSSFKFFPLSS